MSKSTGSTRNNHKPAQPQARSGDQKTKSTGLLISTPIVASMALGDYLGSACSSLDLGGLVSEMRSQCEQVNRGDLKRPEAILLTQAFTLDAIFNEVARRAAIHKGQLEPFERLLRLAFKAQTQCRSTLETLANIKNPPVVLARQANISNGPQQVNNGVAVTPAREIQNEQNKLLEADDGKWMDTRTACTPSRVDPEMAPVGSVNRAEDT